MKRTGLLQEVSTDYILLQPGNYVSFLITVIIFFFLNLKCLQCLTRVYFTKICIFCEKVQARFSKMMALAFRGLLNCQLYVFLSDFSQH